MRFLLPKGLDFAESFPEIARALCTPFEGVIWMGARLLDDSGRPASTNCSGVPAGRARSERPPSNRPHAVCVRSAGIAGYDLASCRSSNARNPPEDLPRTGPLRYSSISRKRQVVRAVVEAGYRRHMAKRRTAHIAAGASGDGLRFGLTASTTSCGRLPKQGSARLRLAARGTYRGQAHLLRAAPGSGFSGAQLDEINATLQSLSCVTRRRASPPGGPSQGPTNMGRNRTRVRRAYKDSADAWLRQSVLCSSG